MRAAHDRIKTTEYSEHTETDKKRRRRIGLHGEAVNRLWSQPIENLVVLSFSSAASRNSWPSAISDYEALVLYAGVGAEVDEQANLIAQPNLVLCKKFDALSGQFQLQTLLIDWLDKPAALLLINLKACSENPVRLRFEYQLAYIRFSFRVFRVFRG